MTSTAGMPLDGLRVLDLSNFLAAPFLTMLLGDFGAEVIKVERPDGGDELRLWGRDKDGVGLYFKVVNRNKKSITVDLRTALGLEIVKRLARSADVIVENYRPGTLERWGMGYDVLSEINPRIVLVRVTGFGQTGPYRSRPGFGTLAEAFSGYAYVHGEPGGAPQLPACGLADATTGLTAAFLAMVALREREQSGLGQAIDIAIYEPLFTLLGPHVVDYDQLGVVQERNGSRLPFTAPRNVFRTQDGQFVSISGSAQSTFERICTSVGRPELAADPRFGNNRLRLENVDALDATLQQAVAGFDLDDLLARFEHHQATIAPVYSVAQIFEDPHYRARGNIVAVGDDELGGDIRMQDVVGRLSRTPGAVRHAGPRLGEHNREILVDRLGFSEDELLAARLPL
jgi:crotonobetainyl-CoA:carnitine CoA-transferase CaiB-like acyl-CoA transferase